MSVISNSPVSLSKNDDSFLSPSVPTNNELKVLSDPTSVFSTLGLDFSDDEFSMNDVQSKAEENTHKALAAALERNKNLEEELRKASIENSNYAKNLKDSLDQSAELESTLNRLQVEFEHYKATTVSTLESRNKALQVDMERLAEKLMDEAERRAELEHSKQVLEAELEELSQTLFEEANKMVSDERRINSEWEKKHSNLLSKLNDVKVLLDSEKEQSAELKTRVEELIQEKDAINSQETEVANNAGSGPRLTRSLSTSTSSAARSHHSSDSGYRGTTSQSNDLSCLKSNLSFHSSDHRFQEFKEFLEAPSNKGIYLSSKFMKRALNEDVDPALRFDSGLLTGWMNQKRLMSAAQTGNINIYPYKNDQENISSETSQCAFCVTSKVKEIQYQYNIAGGDAESKLLCHQCRDRLLAVCKFFAFLRMARAGVLKASPQKLYLDCLQTKHAMFLARVGAEFAPVEEPVEHFSEENSQESTTETSHCASEPGTSFGPPLPGSIS